MRFSEHWLREWVNPDIDTDTLVEQLTTAGLEVDAVEPAAAEFSGIVVAEVVDMQPHPDADKLRVCQVNDGDGEHKQVVCGAANVCVGMKAPFARVGASLPGIKKLKKAKLRGVESFGMLCSEQELGLAETAEGLMALPVDAEPGTDIRDFLQLDDKIIELDLTPNRGDCLGIIGVAREVAALNEVTLTPVETDPVPAVNEERFPVQLDAPADCPVYCGRVIRNIDPGAQTPLWMQEKLRRSGIRSISPVVDVTNYVLLELGQPLHAFDLRQLSGAIHVRRAQAGEQLTLLDGKQITLDDDVLLIADEARPLALAGVMGGEDSGVVDDTRDIFLESAWFNPLAIAGRARRYGLHTDSSHRFERGVDPQLQARAIERATVLLLTITGGEPGPLIQVADGANTPSSPTMTLRQTQANRVLGVELPASQIEGYLTRLGMAVDADGEGQWRVTPPSHRFDIAIEADLIEELARLYGYDRLPQSRPEVSQCMQPREENRLHMDLFRDALVQRGWQEAITYSFVDPEIQSRLSPDRGSIELSNPLSSEMSQMRTSHFSGLVGALRHNQNRQQQQIRLFETGLNFIQAGSGLEQDVWISGVACGSFWPEQWGTVSRKIDFFDVKGDVESIIALSRAPGDFEFRAETHPAMHPGQTARLYRGGQPAGWLGVLHPALEAELNIDGPVILFELAAGALCEAMPRRFTPVSKFPQIRRDLNFVLAESVTSGEILTNVQKIAPETIKQVQILDIYRGKGIESGRKSLTLGLILQEFSRTLTDEDVEDVINRVIQVLKDVFGATLRD